MPRIDGEQLARQVFTSTLELCPTEEPYVAVVDGVQIPRTSWKLVGSSWLYNPTSPPFQRGIHRAQRFVDLAVLLPESPSGYRRAVPLRWDPAIPVKGVRPAGLAAGKEWQVGLEQLTWLRKAPGSGGAQPATPGGGGR